MSSNSGNVDLSEVQQASTTGIHRAFNLLEDEESLPKGEYSEQFHQTIFMTVCQDGDYGGGALGYMSFCGPCFKGFPRDRAGNWTRERVKLTEALNRLGSKTRHKQREKSQQRKREIQPFWGDTS